jgi:hypothetical protein
MTRAIVSTKLGVSFEENFQLTQIPVLVKPPKHFKPDARRGQCFCLGAVFPADLDGNKWVPQLKLPRRARRSAEPAKERNESP